MKLPPLVKKHVCIDARLITFSGIGTFLKAILAEICQNPLYEITLLHFSKDLPILQAYKANHLISVKSSIYTLKEQLELPLKIPKCDLFWSPHFNVPLLPIRAKKRLTTIHDTFHLTFSNEMDFLKKIYAKIFYNGACLLSDHVTTISEFSKQELLNRCSLKSEKLKVIKLGAKSIFRQIDRNETLHQKLKLPDRYLLVVTNFKPHKNFQRILKACANICPIVVVGKRDTAQGVLTTGHVDEEELVYLYSQAEALVFPSLYEGYGLPPMEAMASGCPVVVSKEASLPEVCEDSAEYVDAYKEASIQEGVLRILNDSLYRDSLIKKGLKLAKKRTLEMAAKDYVEYVTMILQ